MMSCDLVVSVRAAAVMFASLRMQLCVSHSDCTTKAVVTKPSFDSGKVFSLEYILFLKVRWTLQ